MLKIIKAPEYWGRPEKMFNAAAVEAAWIVGLAYRAITGNQETGVKRTGVCYDNVDFFTHQLSQITNLLPLINSGDTLYFVDAWYPGLDIVADYCAMNGKTVKMMGYVHAGSYFPGDFTASWTWEKLIEMGRYEIYDRLLVANQYVAGIVSEIVSDPDKVRIVGGPLPYASRFGPEKKQDKVVFNHRWDDDKHPEVFLKLAERFPEYQFVVCSPVPLEVESDLVDVKVFRDKASYHYELHTAKVVFSAAELETFGISVLDGIQQGCIPLLPDAACYPSMYPDLYLYETFEECVEKLKMFMTVGAPLPDISFLESFSSNLAREYLILANEKVIA